MRKQLKSARDARVLVTVTRRRGWAETDGYVAAVGREWCAIVRVEDLSFQGIVLVRNEDVRRITPQKRQRRTSRAFLAKQGLWPPSAPALLDLDSTVGLLVTAGSLSRTLGFSNERRGRGFFVATVDRVGKTRFDNREVKASGRWKQAPMQFPHARLTRVLLWDPYVETVTQLADESAEPG